MFRQKVIFKLRELAETSQGQPNVIVIHLHCAQNYHIMIDCTFVFDTCFAHPKCLIDVVLKFRMRQLDMSDNYLRYLKLEK